MPLSSPESLLIIRPSALGDVCRTVPVLSSIRAAWPDTRIGWLVQEEFADVVRAHPDLDEVVLFPRSKFRGAWHSPGRARAALAWIRSLRGHGWEVALDCQGLARSGLFAWACGARARVGFADAREWGWIFLNERVRTSERHAVDRMMSLVDALGVPRTIDMRLHAPADDLEWWAACTQRPRGHYAVFAPRSRWPAKEWPHERWTDLVLACGDLGLEEILLVGSRGESDAVERIRSSIDAASQASPSAGLPSVRSFAGRTTVGQLMAIVRESAVVVANDSAVLHMAVGFDRPLVGLFGPTDPSEVGPYERDGSVLRRPGATGEGHDYRKGVDSDESMRSITVEMVAEAMARALGTAG